VDDVKPGSRRDEQVRATRLAVVQAATDLFLAQGYAATTIDQIAAAAGVSRPTVFAVGSKARLLALARDMTMAGDDEQVAVSQRESAQRVLTEVDPQRLLALLAEHITGVQERYSRLDEVLHSAAGGDEELATLWRTSEEQRRAGARLFVGAVRERTLLALPEQEAVDVLWMLMAPDVHTRLVRVRGWSRGRYVAWLSGALRALLVQGSGTV
jgi:AcrR family transcriptional regulator